LLNAGMVAERQGDTGRYKLELNGQYNDGYWPLPAAFASSDTAVATVDGYGFLTALKNGYVEISAAYNGETYKKGLFVYTSSPATFTSSDTTVATVDAYGVLTVLKNGYVQITAACNGENYKKGLFVYTTLDAGESAGNDSKATAGSMAASTSDPSISRFYKGSITTGDTDWFRFTLSQGAIVNVGFLSQSATADVKMELFNAADILLASSVSNNGAPVILPVGLSAGDYYLKLSIAGDVDQTGNYIVAYKIIETLPVKNAIPIAFAETKSGTINTLADQQDLTFTLSTERGVRFLFTPSSPTAKYRLALLNSNQSVIDWIDCMGQKPVSFETI
ncbi:MAG: hypothetical protein WCK00_03935, partial [Deltaproteobacteria bacterium]